MMRKFTFFTVFALLSVFVFGQKPTISVNTTSVTETLEVGDTMVVKVAVTNVGGRELEWEAKRYAPEVTFVKEDSSDWTSSENQDRISSEVWITRKNERGIYNAFSESSYSSGNSPDGTLWAPGYSGSIPVEEYENWNYYFTWRIQDRMNKPYSIYIEDEDEYLDIMFHYMTCCGLGGGFSYTRDGLAYWLDVFTEMGEIIPTKSDTLVFEISARDLIAGHYIGAIQIHSNDSINPMVIVDVDLTVTGTPVPNFVTDLGFPDVPIGTSNTQTAELRNDGTGILEVTGITQLTSVFTASEEVFTIAPDGSYFLDVTFTPDQPDSTYIDTLYLATNDPSNPIIKLALEGDGIEPSEIAIVHVPTSHTIDFGTTVTDSIIIKNTGTTTLNFELDFPLNTAPVTFTKENYADYTLMSNQDRIASDVWITRGDQRGLFNAAIEDGFDGDAWDSPKGTIWNYDKTRDYIDIGDYEPLFNMENGRDLIKNEYSLYLVNHNRFFDVYFEEWQISGAGGGFSYTRQEVAGWINANQLTGSIAPGDSIINILTYDANFAFGGTHNANIMVYSNDPDQMEISVPIELIVNGTPDIDVDPAAINFGDVIEGASDTNTIVIQNTGSSLLTVSNLSVVSSNLALSETSFTVEAGMSKEIMVSWSPDAPGTLTDTVSITSDGSTPLIKVPLEGVALAAPTITVHVSAVSDTLVSGDSDVHELIISNEGGSDLDWFVDLLSDAEPVTFTKVDSADWTLPENQDRIRQNVIITRQNTMGIFNIAMEDDYSWGSSPSRTRWSRGRTIEQNSYSDWRSRIDWPLGENLPGSTMSMFLQDYGRYYDVTWHNWTSKGFGGGFSYTRVEYPEWIAGITNGGTIAPGETDTIEVTFDATFRTAGLYNATIKVSSNVPGAEPAEVMATLLVTGEPEIDATPTTYSFGSQGVGVLSDSVEVQITNTGTDMLEISAITTDSSSFIINTNMLNIPPGEYMSIYVTFTPEYAIAYLDTIRIMSNAISSAEYKIPIAGTGIPVADIEVSPMTFNDVVRFGDSTTYTLTVSNVGGDDLTWEIENYPVTFTKVDMADHTLVVNQDRITSNVWITRANTQGLFNIQQEAGYSATAPADTRWAFGYTDKLAPTDYQNWIDAVSGNPTSMIDSNISLYLVTDDIYYDVMFHSYSGGGPGGGFSYTRRTDYPAWIDVSEGSGIYGPDSTNELTLSFYAGAALSGNNTYTIMINSDDPDEPVIEISLDFEVYSLVKNMDLEDQVMNVGFGSTTADFAGVFSSADNDSISYIVVNEYDSVVTIDVTGTVITITEQGVGTSAITVRAQTESGDVQYADLLFTVNGAPVVAEPISNITANQGFGTQDIDISNVFTDPNSDPLTISSESSMMGVVTTNISGSILTIAEAGVGSSTITLTATDGIAVTPTTTDFLFTVVEGTSNDNANTDEFTIYPNPTQGDLTITLMENVNSKVKVTVFDVAGKQVFTKLFNSIDEQISLDLAGINDGMYQIRVTTESFTKTQNLIKH